MSLFLVILIAPNKEFSKIGSKLLRFGSKSETIYMINIFLLNVDLFCFIRQLPLNLQTCFYQSSFGARLVLFIVGDLVTSSDNPLDFRDEMLLVLLIFLKYLFIGLNTK